MKTEHFVQESRVTAEGGRTAARRAGIIGVGLLALFLILFAAPSTPSRLRGDENQDSDESVDWFAHVDETAPDAPGSEESSPEAAGENRDSDAQYNLRCYYGLGVEQNYEEAAKWYLKAAEQGNAEAQNNLGKCYGNGLGVEQNYEEAAKWFRKAAEQGNTDAQTNLGHIYEESVEPDYEGAVKWYRKAA